MARRLLAALSAFTIIVPAGALAQGFTPQVSSTATTPLATNQLYDIETSCSKLAALPSYTDRDTWRAIFPSDKKALSFFVAVQTAPLAGAPALADEVKSSLMLSFSFSIDQQQRQLVDNRDGGSCNQAVLVYGVSPIYVVPVAAYSNQFSGGAIVTAIDSLTKTITAAAPLFTAAVGGGAAVRALGDVDAAAPAVSGLVGAFDPSHTELVTTSTALMVGDTTVTTPYSAVRITVRPIGDVVTDPHAAYRLSLKNAAVQAVAGAGSAIDPSTDDKLHASCEVVVNRLAAAGFASKLDQTYGVIHAAAVPLTSWNQMLTCLGPERAALAITLPRVMYEGVNSDIQVTSADLNGAQPPFGDIKGRMALFTQQLGAYAKSAVPSTVLAGRLDRNMSPTVSVDDPLALLGDNPPSGTPGVFDFLIAQGYHHFGFFAQVTPDMIASQEYGVVVGFVGVKAAPGAGQASFGDAIAIYPHFAGGATIDKLTVSNDQDEVKALVGTRSGDNGFTLVAQAAPAPPSQAAPQPATPSPGVPLSHPPTP